MIASRTNYVCKPQHLGAEAGDDFAKVAIAREGCGHYRS